MAATPSPAATEAPTPIRRRRLAIAIAVVIALALVLLVVLNIVDRGDGFGVLDAESSARQYFTVFFFVLADAIVPIFPGETTLNAASTLAAQGQLELGLVMLAGALGAIVGDSCLYWIARRSSSRVADRLAQAKRNAKVATALDVLEGRGGPVLLVLGRYVPGLRFVVNATMGLAKYPYPRFLLWSSVGGISWSIYTCALAYWIGSALADYPIASIVISGLVTTAILGAAYLVYHRTRNDGDAPSEVAA
jgi:membrane-associated protein